MPDEPSSTPAQPAPEEPEQEPEPSEVGFRVDGRLTAVRAAGALIFVLIAVFQDGPAPRVFAGLAALVLGGYAVRDWLAPVRLAADAEGVTVVTGFAGRRRLAWDEIERVRVDERRRLGTRSELLEIDAGESLYLFSPYDLGTSCWEAARTLAPLSPRVDRSATP